MKAKTKFTRLWSILLALAMVVGMLPTMVLAAGSESADFVSDPAKALALLNAAKTGTTDSTWDGDTKTLTLNGVNFETEAATAVQLPAGATIVLNGENTITGGDSSSEECYGIYGEGDLTISGTGTLNVTAGNTEDDASYGITSERTLTITGGTVTATGGNAEYYSYGIYGDVTISGGTVTATGGNAYEYSYGIDGDVTISGGTVTATGGTTEDCSYGIDGSVKISGGTVTATGVDAQWYSYGIDGSVTITGGIVTATGGNTTEEYGESYGIDGSVNISGGAVIAKAGSATNAAALNAYSVARPTAYWWRTSASGDYSQSSETAYTGNGSEAHLEIWNWDPTATADFTTDANAARDLLNAAKTGGAANSTWVDDGSGNPTLTLKGVHFVTSAATAVKLPANTTIVLADGTTNTIKGGDSGSEDCYGIYVDNGNLTIQGETVGTGKLIVNGGNATGAEKDSYGIRTEKGDVTITGGTVEVTGGAAVHKSSGIYAKRNDNGSGGYIGGNINISGSAQVTAAGGDVTDATSLSYGLFANAAMTISDSAKVTASGGASSNRSYGIRAYKGNVTISGTANVTATGGAADKISYGIGADDGDVTISGGAVIAKAGSADNIAVALNKAPTLTITAYSWRTLDSGDYYDPDYNWDESHTYVEIKSNPTVTFNANGENASVAPASGTTNAAGKLSTLPTPTRDGYTFKGWNTKQNGTGTTVTEETTFTENTTVYAQWEVATVSIPSVAITGIDAPVSNTALDTEAVCESAGVSNAQPAVTWDSEDDKAGYGKIYTASITLTASEGYKFANSVTATVNGNPATSVTKNANGTLTVTYTFPATDKHNIEITVDTDVRDGDAAKNPTISSGYEIEFCFFVEDADKDGVFINKTGNSITLDDKTLVVDKALVEAFAAHSGGSFTYESLMAVLKDEFDLDELKTEFTGGYDYSVLAYICHSDNAYFDYDDNQIVTNAIVKVNGKKITDNCLGYGSGMEIMPVAYVFSAAKTYTVSFDANGGKSTMADVTGISGEYTLPENGFTAPEGKQFKAWSVGGKEKAVGDKITVTADTTVKAVWENIPATPTEYDILDGANSSWTKDSDGNISVRGSGAFTKFVGVKVDGTLIDAKNYTVKEGSTVVILKEDYLNTCTAGSHTLEIVWTDGSASTTFTVKADSPQTGDNSMMALWIAVLFVSGFGVVTTAVYGKKRKSVK